MTTKESETQQKQSSQKVKEAKQQELHTDYPMSEKDEVKQAERNTQKQQNKGK